jgi:hypothetical protein
MLSGVPRLGGIGELLAPMIEEATGIETVQPHWVTFSEVERRVLLTVYWLLVSE